MQFQNVVVEELILIHWDFMMKPVLLFSNLTDSLVCVKILHMKYK